MIAVIRDWIINIVIVFVGVAAIYFCCWLCVQAAKGLWQGFMWILGWLASPEDVE